MVLNLIRRGPETVRLEAPSREGLNAALRNGSSYPLRGYNSWVRLTVTATGCAGVQVMDRENGYDYELREATNGMVSYSGVFYANRYGPTVYVQNPTDKTEVIMHVETIPPPYSIARFLRRWAGGCHGADKNRTTVFPQDIHRAREKRECQRVRVGRLLPGARTRSPQDHRCGDRAGRAAHHEREVRESALPVTRPVGARLNSGGSHRPQGAGALPKRVAERDQRRASRNGAPSHPVTLAGVSA